MRRALAHLLHRLAYVIHNDERRQKLEIVDEYGVARCRIEVAADDTHGIASEADELPDGWIVHSPVERGRIYGERFGI